MQFQQSTAGRLLLLLAAGTAAAHAGRDPDQDPAGPASAVPLGDLLLLVAGEAALCHRALDRVRQYLAAQLGEVDEGSHALLWVTGAFLLFTWQSNPCTLESRAGL